MGQNKILQEKISRQLHLSAVTKSLFTQQLPDFKIQIYRTYAGSYQYMFVTVLAPQINQSACPKSFLQSINSLHVK